MATPPPPKPAAPAAPAKAPPVAGALNSDNMAAESTNFPPLYEAAILYSADCYDAAQEVLKSYLKTTDGKNSLRTWLMLFDFYQ
ncbi:MAG: hypothetical protein JNM52_08315, partial [Betaproteobacteria bacterium]|nr:hypothetical protein [Betaproteobacteria bacterium]